MFINFELPTVRALISLPYSKSFYFEYIFIKSWYLSYSGAFMSKCSPMMPYPTVKHGESPTLKWNGSLHATSLLSSSIFGFKTPYSVNTLPMTITKSSRNPTTKGVMIRNGRKVDFLLMSNEFFHISAFV